MNEKTTQEITNTLRLNGNRQRECWKMPGMNDKNDIGYIENTRNERHKGWNIRTTPEMNEKTTQELSKTPGVIQNLRRKCWENTIPGMNGNMIQDIWKNRHRIY